jgi:hypothetical protein
MRTIDYSEILRGSAGLAGMKWPDDIGTAELSLFRTFHDRRLQAAWEIEGWPEICLIEQRYFRPMWSANPSYAAGDERFDILSGQYFQSLQNSNFDEPPTVGGVENGAFWAACRPSYSGPMFKVGTAYKVGDIVQSPADGQFYQCVQAHTGAFPPVGPSNYFGPLKAFVRRIENVQVEDGTDVGNGTAHTVIGEFLRVWDKDPRVTTKVVEIPFLLDDTGAILRTFSGHSPTTAAAAPFVWLKFRTRRPQLTGDAWDSTKVYAAGSQVYYLNGAQTVANFYTANTATAAAESPESAAAKWDVVELPYIFGAYLKEGGFADWLVSDGQEQKAQTHEQMALNYLDMEADKLWRQQKQAPRLLMIR